MLHPDGLAPIAIVVGIFVSNFAIRPTPSDKPVACLPQAVSSGNWAAVRRALIMFCEQLAVSSLERLWCRVQQERGQCVNREVEQTWLRDWRCSVSHSGAVWFSRRIAENKGSTCWIIVFLLRSLLTKIYLLWLWRGKTLSWHFLRLVQ